MSDQIVETTTQGWGSRLMESIKGVAIGLLLFVVSFPLLWWNEGRAVQTFKSLAEGAKAVISVPADKVEPQHEGKLVHVSGKAVTDETLTDPEFGISANALHLARQAEMYQWVESVKTETKKKVGGGEETTKTYSYHREWKSELVDSSKFKEPRDHENPRSMAIESRSWSAEKVTLGAFALTAGLVDRIRSSEPIVVTADMIRGATAELGTGAQSAASEDPGAKAKAKKGQKAIKAKPGKAKGKPGPAVAVASTGGAKGGVVTHPPIVNGGFYIGADASSPAVGDVRVHFTKVAPADVSVLAAQTGQSFAAYQTKAGDALEDLRLGTLTAAAMFAAAQSENAMMTWILRLLGFILMAAGIGMVLRPLAVVADVLPFLGDILRLGIGFVAVSVSLPLTLITIAIAWLVYRPVMGVGLLATGILAFVLVKIMAQKRKAAAHAAPVAAQPAA